MQVKIKNLYKNNANLVCINNNDHEFVKCTVFIHIFTTKFEIFQLKYKELKIN